MPALEEPPSVPTAEGADSIDSPSAGTRAFGQAQPEDPVLALRSRQWAEYQKLCTELRLGHNSAIKQAFNPSEVMHNAKESEEVMLHQVGVQEKKHRKKVVCECGAYFAADALFCLKCGRGRGTENERTESETITGSSVCSHCGNHFAADAIFCRKCGAKREEQEEGHKSENAHDSMRSVHEYSFDKLYLGDRQMPPLAAALAIDRHLLALFVKGCGMMDAGMIGLCEQLKRSQTLECIDVSENRFSIGGAEACLRLVTGAQRLVLVKSKDTCLEEHFCNKRALPAKYAAVRKEMQDILMKRGLAIS